MADYSDLIMLVGAMVIFSFLSRNAAYMFYQSDTSLFQSDVEYEAIALAQSIMDEVKWTETSGKLASLVSEYDGTTETVSLKDGEYEIDYYISMSVNDILLNSSIVTTQQVSLKITSDYLADSSYVDLKYVKSFN